ncbi:MAG: helix-turn-helix transcriptional regulator [Spirosomataceae bacterium]
MTDYSANFRKLREKAGHTQESLAIKMGVCTSIINRMESHKRKIEMDMIPKLVVALNKTPEEVIRELHGVTVYSSIQENHGNGVNIEQSDLKKIIELYERIITEKDKHITFLEDKLNRP